jgi:hypothetical protein
MEHDDREYTDMLNDELKDVEPGAGLHGKVRDGIARNIVRVHRRNTALGAVAVAIVLTMALSTVTPVFGRNGTLPQVIAAMAAERQAEKMSRTLGAAPVQQTGTALQTSVATVQAVSDSALSETDGILALVIAERADKPVADVLKMRTDGLGWGLIMAQLNVSGRDIGEAMSQAETVAVASSPSAASQGQGATSKPAVSNKDGDKVVVNGEITGVSTTFITVAGKMFAIVSETQLKYRGKAITPPEITVKLSAGKLYATVQGTKLADTSLRANLIVVQDTLEEAQQEQEQEQEQEQANGIQQQIRGNVTFVSPALLQISGFVPGIVLNADTKVEQVGAGTMDMVAIKVGQTVQVHVRLSGTTYTAQQVHIEDKYVKPSTAVNEQPTGTSVTTWQGTIVSISSDLKFIIVTTEANPPATVMFRILATSVLQDAKHKTVTFASLVVGQKVTITGKVLADGSAEVVKLILTTGTSATPQPENPGKGNGKH